jgi:hypothetical protein
MHTVRKECKGSDEDIDLHELREEIVQLLLFKAQMLTHLL